jgi:hypothetical protein
MNIVKFAQAIMEVGEVIQFYDSDKRFPAWGFGGNIYGGTVSHCFNLNGALGVNYGVNSEVRNSLLYSLVQLLVQQAMMLIYHEFVW